jgi:REP element-mobilizing transposase RayT
MTDELPELGAPTNFRRRSLRLTGYDYSSSGAYFVTVCTADRRPLLGRIVDGEMQLNEYGRIVSQTWEWLAAHYDYVDLDAYVVMPNHLHGVLILSDDCRGRSRTPPTIIVPRKPLGRLVGAFKTVSAKQMNQLRGTPGADLWQRNYYEHIIRSDAELDRIREYIVNNPAQWSLDHENPEVVGARPGRDRSRTTPTWLLP